MKQDGIETTYDSKSDPGRAGAASARDDRYGRIIKADRVSGALYTAPDIFEEELERIWERDWIYLGHESQIAEPRQFFCRRMGREPVIVTRAPDGGIHVLINRCAHRGNAVCLENEGRAGSFRCIYHGWNYAHDGSLLYVPYESGYGSGFDRSRSGLPRVPRIGVHRGFIFASLAAEGVDLRTHLGRTWDYINDFCDLAPEGTVDLSRGCLKTIVHGNWKMVYENICDGYHPPQLHRSVFTIARRDGLVIDAAFGDESLIVTRDLGDGHIMLDFAASNRRIGGATFDVGGSVSQGEIDKYHASLRACLGQGRADELLSRGSSNVGIFPNLGLLFQDVRVIEPVAVDQTIIYNYPALLDGAPDEINRARLFQEIRAYGPAGSVGPDDHEIYDRTQSALARGKDQWILISRGMERESHDADGTTVSRASDETAQRAFWHSYKLRMQT